MGMTMLNHVNHLRHLDRPQLPVHVQGSKSSMIYLHSQ